MPIPSTPSLAVAAIPLRNLSSEEALTLTPKISNGVARGNRGKNVDQKVAADPMAPTKDAKPFAHPKYWAAFILIGDPN
jgi:CHAT domain-containing protein